MLEKDKNIWYIVGEGALLLLLFKTGEKFMISTEDKKNFKAAMKIVADRIKLEYSASPGKRNARA